jgi:hypothetical protein
MHGPPQMPYVAPPNTAPPLRRRGVLMVVVACLAIARLVSLVGIWGWKRWGIYGYLGCSVLSSIMSFRAGTTPAAILYDVLTTALVTTMLLAKRHQFD